MNYDEITVSAWFYKNANDTVNADAIFGGWYWTSNAQLRQGFDLRFFNTTNPNIVNFVVETKDSAGTVTELSNFYTFTDSTNGWHHVVGVYNKITGEQKLYVDGLNNFTNGIKNHPDGNTIVPLTFILICASAILESTMATLTASLTTSACLQPRSSATDIAELYNYTGTGGSSSSSSSSVSQPSSAQPTPTAATNSATSITQTSATLNATVNANNTNTTAYFQYGLTTSFGNTTSAQTLTGSTNQAVTANISGLPPSTVYYYRIVAQNSRNNLRQRDEFYDINRSFFHRKTYYIDPSGNDTNNGLSQSAPWKTLCQS